jgi:hypothetical protein
MENILTIEVVNIIRLIELEKRLLATRLIA